MAEGAVLAEVVPDAEVQAEDQEQPQEVPSVFSVINRYLVGTVEVGQPSEDGSRAIRLHSASGGTVIEAILAPQLCAFVSDKLVEIEVITQEDEKDAGAEK